MARNETQKGSRLRPNILLLISFGYVVVLVVFVGVSRTTDNTATDVYGVIEAPLVALIGGSLALAKDILKADDDISDGNASNDGS